MGVGVRVGVGVADRVGVEVGVLLVTELGRRVGVALAVGAAVLVAVASSVGLGVTVKVSLAADSDAPGSAGVGVVMMIPPTTAFDVRAVADVGVALDSNRTGMDAVLAGGTGVKMGVALAITADIGPEAAAEVEVGSGIAVKTAESVGLGITVTTDGSKERRGGWLAVLAWVLDLRCAHDLNSAGCRRTLRPASMPAT